MRKFKKAFIIAFASCIIMTGCSPLKDEMITAIQNNQEIKLSVNGEVNTDRNELFWGELDQLRTYSNLRDSWDDTLKIIKFGYGSKNGVIFVDLDGSWVGNNTLYNAFQNKEFASVIWRDNKTVSKLAKLAIEEFSDVSNESTAIYASINAYYNILPASRNGESGIFDKLSRAQVMTSIYRGDTPVCFNEENEDFKNAVGRSEYNIYAQNMTDVSYLKYQNGGLNYDTYNSACTRAEAIYMLVQRYFKNEFDNVDIRSASFDDCKNAGDIKIKLGVDSNAHAIESYELEWCLQNNEDGCPEELYKALVVARNKGIIKSDTTRWNEAISLGELLNFMINAYTYGQDGNTGYKLNAKNGANAGESLYVSTYEVDTSESTYSSISGTGAIDTVDITDLNDLIEVYGDEIDMTAEELSEVYENSKDFKFEAIDKIMTVDNCGALNIRTGPNTEYRIIGSVPKGAKVHVVAFCRDTGWYRIIANKKIVYQCEIYFTEDNN